MLRTPIAVATVVLALHSASVAEADSLTDSLGPREIAVGETMRAEAVGSLATVLNPAGAALNNQLTFEGSYGFNTLDSASIANVAACDSTTPVAGCFYYHYLSAEPEIGGMENARRLHEGGIALARAISPNIVLGTNTRYFDYNSDLAGEGDESGYAVDLGVIVKPTPLFAVAAVGYNLIGTDTPQYPRGVATGLSIRPGQGTLGISLDALWNLEREEGESTGRYGAGAEFFLQNGPNAYPLRAGGVYDAFSESGYLTGGVGYATPKFGIDIGGRKQLSGGDELIIQAGIRLIGPTGPQAR